MRQFQSLPLNDYLLFIDTEASGLPKKWYLPYNVPGNWPYALQVSWIIYDKEGQKVKEQNHYINDNDFKISPSALRIHGLTKEFLQQNGIAKIELLQLLSDDLAQYNPKVIGHFTELDYHILGAEFYRGGINNPLEKLPIFCIMKASQHLQQNPQSKFLRLGDLYELLFKQPLLAQHNAMTDATATADCYFELVRRNEVKSFTQPPIVFHQKQKIPFFIGWIIVFLLILLSVFLIACYYE